MGTNVMSGIGAALDEARKNLGTIDRTFSDSVEQEIRRHPLAPGVALRALKQGACCSIEEGGAVGPFDVHKPFAGIVAALIDDGKTKVVVASRGAMLVTVSGLEASSIGSAVHVLSNGTFALAGGAEMGQVLSIERLDKRLAIVAFKRLDDPRPFGESGKLVERF